MKTEDVHMIKKYTYSFRIKKKILEMNVSGEIMVMVEDWIIWDVFRTSYGWMIISISVNLQAIVNSCNINADFKLLKLNRVRPF